jgi:outer membrane protein TolC/anti-anti-sigma regulatory factor
MSLFRHFGYEDAGITEVSGRRKEGAMLRITVKKQGSNEIWELEGKLSGEWVKELERCWKENPPPHGVATQVHLTAVSFIDSAGKQLLAEMHARGAEIKGCGCMTRAVVEEITRETQTAGGQGSPRKVLAVMLFLTLALGGASNLGAQEKPPLKLTVQDAVALALRQNPQVQIAAVRFAESTQDKNITRAALLPQANLAVTDSVTRLNTTALIGKPFPGFPQHAGPFQVFQAGPQFSMALLDLTLWRRYQAAKYGMDASRADQQSVREQITMLVVSQYLGCLQAEANVQAARSRVQLAQALYDQAADLQKSGAGTGIDTLRANVELQNEKQRLLAAETTDKTTMYGLVRLLSLDPQQNIEFGDALSFFETPESNATDSLAAAYSARPELRALEARASELQSDKQAVSESRLPSMRFSGNWSYMGISVTTGIPTYLYAVSINVPLTTGGRIHAENIKANLELQRIAEQRAELRNQIALEVKTAAATLASARQQVDVANLGVKLAQEEVTQARDRFTAGVANNIEVISAQDALARANDNQVAALYGYNQARADLARATGQIELLYTGKKTN